MSPPWTEADIVVVGAGPAGMAAAAEAAQAGCGVTVIDTYSDAGGQYHRVTAPGLDTRCRASGGRDSAASVGRFAKMVAAGEITLLPATTVWTAAVEPGPAPFLLHLTGSGAAAAASRGIRACAVVLATGATDRVLPFPGWDLPGVFTAGGAQAMLKGQAIRVGNRVIVGGSGPFLLPVAAGLAAAGCEVREIVEAQPLRGLTGHIATAWTHHDKVTEASAYFRTLARHRVRLRFRSAVTAAAGDGRVEQVTVSRLGPSWEPLAGHDRTIAVDAACVSFGFVPQVGLATLLGCRIATDEVWGDAVVVVDGRQASSVEGVFAAGEISGVAGSAAAEAEGAIAGLAAASALGRMDDATFDNRTQPWVTQRDHERRFAGALGRMHRVRAGWPSWLTDDTVVCRCEEVDVSSVIEAIRDLSATDMRSVKLTTRCGMGYCQGRICGDGVAGILTHHGHAPADAAALAPPLLTPVPLARVAELADAEAGADQVGE